MKITLILFVVFISSLSFSQESAVSVLQKYNFTAQNIFEIVDVANSSYSFTVNATTQTYSKANGVDNKITRSYDFNYKNMEGEKFTLLKVKGKEPSGRKIKKFNKEKNSVQTGKDILLNANNFFIKLNDDNTTIIGFTFPKEQLPSKLAFMAHSTGFIYIDKESAKINKIEIKSNESFNLKIFYVTSLDIVFNLDYDVQHEMYIISNENTEMNVLIFGGSTNIKTEETYSDYKF